MTLMMMLQHSGLAWLGRMLAIMAMVVALFLPPLAATAVAGGAWGSNHMMVVVLISRRAILGLKP